MDNDSNKLTIIAFSGIFLISGFGLTHGRSRKIYSGGGYKDNDGFEQDFDDLDSPEVLGSGSTILESPERSKRDHKIKKRQYTISMSQKGVLGTLTSWLGPFITFSSWAVNSIKNKNQQDIKPSLVH